MTYYKLTDKDGRTHGGMQWGPAVRHEATGLGEGLCSDGWILCYDHPLKAAFFNSIGADFDPSTMRLWEFVPDEGTPALNNRGLKCGVRAGTTVREVPVPQITMAQRVRAAILITKCVFGEKLPAWDTWAEDWLSGKNRTAGAAAVTTYAIYTYASYARVSAARVCTVAAADAYAYACTAAAARVCTVAAADAHATDVYAYATAQLAADAARVSAIAAADANLDLVALIEQAIREEPA